MSTHNIGFNEDLTKIIFELSSTIIKYAPYFFCWQCAKFFSSPAGGAGGSGDVKNFFSEVKYRRLKKLLHVLVCNLSVKTKMAFLSRKMSLLTILLHGQFIHHKQICLYQNTLFFTAQQCAYQSFLVTS